MNQTIASAIQRKRLITFTYHGIARTVEPHTYGTDNKAVEKLSAWQILGKYGDPEDWRMYIESDMSLLTVLATTFQYERSGYARNDPRMKVVYAQI